MLRIVPDSSLGEDALMAMLDELERRASTGQGADGHAPHSCNPHIGLCVGVSEGHSSAAKLPQRENKKTERALSTATEEVEDPT